MPLLQFYKVIAIFIIVRLNIWLQTFTPMMNENLDSEMGEFFNGYNRRISTMRLDGDLKEPLDWFLWLSDFSEEVFKLHQQIKAGESGENKISDGLKGQIKP